MSREYESADLILKLYDLRREEKMREARQWMIAFMPQSAQDVMDALMGEHGAYFRMVTSYWDMAASLVNSGAIDEQMFQDANAEHLLVFSKIEPFIPELREKLPSISRLVPELAKLVMRMPNAKQLTENWREAFRQMAARRAEAAAKAKAAGQTTDATAATDQGGTSKAQTG
jgi:hypothetical protein